LHGSRVLLRAVQHSQNLDAPGSRPEAINENEGCATYDQFAGSPPAARSTDSRMLQQQIDLSLDLVKLIQCGVWIVLGDVFDGRMA